MTRRTSTAVSPKPKVLMVEDHQLFSDAICASLLEAGMEVEVASDEGGAAAALNGSRPDLILMDIGLPDTNGIALGRKLLETDPDLKILALTALTDPEILRQALRSGFVGYINKDVPVAQFMSNIATALAGNVVIPRRMARAVPGARTEEEKEAARLAQHLTPREKEVLSLLAEGCNSEEMAERLNVSLNTIRTHVQNILTKLQVRSRLEAATLAVRHGIVKVQPPRDG